jgi:hypothetical protein
LKEESGSKVATSSVLDTPILLQTILYGGSLVTIVRLRAVSKAWETASKHVLANMPSLVVVGHQFVQAFRFATMDWHNCLPPDYSEDNGYEPGDLWTDAGGPENLPPPQDRGDIKGGWPAVCHPCCKLGDGSLYFHSKYSTVTASGAGFEDEYGYEFGNEDEYADEYGFDDEDWDIISRPVVFDAVKNTWGILPLLQKSRINYMLRDVRRAKASAHHMQETSHIPAVCAIGDQRHIFVTEKADSPFTEHYYVYNLENRYAMYLRVCVHT